eukprot:gene18149-23803_t
MISERTIKYFNSIKYDNVERSGGAGSSASLEGLKRIESSWNALKNGGWMKQPQTIVYTENKNNIIEISDINNFDICICGGTLGIFYALTLQKLGYKTCIIERALVQGRSQEWNISKKELQALIRLNILTKEEINNLISVEFNPVRVGFTSSPNDTNGFELLTNDVLNTAVISSKDLLNSNNMKISSTIVIDAMGNASPIAKQIRGIKEPDGICIVVGTCARGYNPSRNTMGDYFWEAFPAGSGNGDRTTYLFTYLDAKPERPGVGEIFDDYWDLLPSYQDVNLDDLELLRILYGVFPTYRNSPLQSDLDRILQVGDASGIQSPLSFGGFGSLTRHIERIVSALDEAIKNNLTSSEYLSLLNPYQPNLSAGWMFQRSMSVPINKNPSSNLIVSILSNSFYSMKSLALTDFFTPLKIIPHVGVFAIADFLYHLVAMFYYTWSYNNIGPIIKNQIDSNDKSISEKFKLKRLLDKWKFGSGLDYYDHE